MESSDLGGNPFFLGGFYGLLTLQAPKTANNMFWEVLLDIWGGVQSIYIHDQ